MSLRPGSILFPRETKGHVLLVLQPGNQLGDDTLPSDGPPNLVPDIFIQNLQQQLGLDNNNNNNNNNNNYNNNYKPRSSAWTAVLCRAS